MPKLSQDQQSQRRNHILDAAELCFASAGFHRTSMQKICQRAAVSPGALYLYFDSKEALIAGIAERDRTEVIERFAALTTASNFIEAMRSVMNTCILQQPAYKSQLYLAIAAEAVHNRAVAHSLAECDNAIRNSLTGILRRAHLDGRINPVAPVERIAAVMSLIADGMFWRRAVDPACDLVAIADDLTEVIGRYLRTSEFETGEPETGSLQQVNS